MLHRDVWIHTGFLAQHTLASRCSFLKWMLYFHLQCKSKQSCPINRQKLKRSLPKQIGIGSQSITSCLGWMERGSDGSELLSSTSPQQGREEIIPSLVEQDPTQHHSSHRSGRVALVPLSPTANYHTRGPGRLIGELFRSYPISHLKRPPWWTGPVWVRLPLRVPLLDIWTASKGQREHGEPRWHFLSPPHRVGAASRERWHVWMLEHFQMAAVWSSCAEWLSYHNQDCVNNLGATHRHCSWALSFHHLVSSHDLRDLCYKLLLLIALSVPSLLRSYSLGLCLVIFTLLWEDSFLSLSPPDPPDMTIKIYVFQLFHCRELYLSVGELACKLNHWMLLKRPDIALHKMWAAHFEKQEHESRS